MSHYTESGTYEQFHNRIRILLCIDQDEFARLTGLSDAQSWNDFRFDPPIWFIEASSDQSKGLFKAIEVREARAEIRR
jgi:hypothetical protein